MPLVSYKKSSQIAIRDWLSAAAWSNPFGVTLNLKQGVWIEAHNGRSFVRLTEQHANRNLRYFVNRLEKRYLGNAARRYSKKLPIIPVLEGGKGHRLHYHLIIDLPATAALEDVYPLFVAEWMKTQWGYGQVHIQPCRDDGWLAYITKLRSKIDVSESIDWMNLHHPSLTAH